MSSVVPPEFQQFVQEQIVSGRYHSADEVVSNGPRLLQERERRLQELRAEIQPALDELDRGDAIDVDDEGLRVLFDEIMSEVDRELAARDRATGNGPTLHHPF
ncbi:MAG: type II toxin-antitoxin system ParD family antitoxin [Planctomycetes bacterium]|nr:type II toxin-antitoxin system ParD family antitoxin [Planctomycetota bacterium]